MNVNKPNKLEEVDNRTLEQIVTEIEDLDLQANKALKDKELLYRGRWPNLEMFVI